jgi:hypothetical protein
MTGPLRSGVPAKPNEARVRGKLLRAAPAGDGRGSLWDLALDEAHDIEGLPNFARSYVGRTISVYAQRDLPAGAAASDRLEAHVAWRGDERGGRFVLVDDDVRKL